jgi:CIC family chloride channel protein
VVAAMIAKFHGSHTLFSLPELFVATNWEYFLFAIVGIVGGGLAVCFMALMQKTNEIAQRIPGSFLNRALLGGSLLGGILVVFPQTFGLGEQVIQDALNLEITIGLLVLLVLAKLLATTVSFAAGFSGGVFGPTVYMGTMLGTAIGLGVTELFETTSSPAVYGIAGMGAVISRVIGSPIATILFVFELTGSYSLTTAVMIAVVVSNMMTQTFFNYSYFNHQLRTRGVDPEQSRAQRLLQKMPIDSLILPAPVVVTDDTTIAVVRAAIIKQDASEAYIVDHENRLLGQISATTLLRINDERTFSQPVNQFMSKPPITLTPQMNVLDTFDQLRDFVGVSVPVVTDKTSRHFKGIIHENTVMHTYLKVTQQSEQEMH